MGEASLVCVSCWTVAEAFARIVDLDAVRDKRERQYASNPVGTAKVAVTYPDPPRQGASGFQRHVGIFVAAIA